MKNVTVRILCVWISVLLLLLPVLAACGEPPSPEEETTAAEETVSTEDTEKQPTVAKKDHKAEFTALYCMDTFKEGYFFIEEEKRKPGSDMDDKVYERVMNVEEHLGVEIIAENGGNYQEYTAPLRTSISSGDDTYQLVMTHTYQEVAGLITKNNFRDFQDFDSIQLDAGYWNRALMEDLSINDRMYCGYNDFCLASCYMVAFNKDMAGRYGNSIGNLYEQVRNKQWTLEKLIEYSSLVSEDNGDGTWDDQDTYGFSCFAWVPIISFQHAADISVVKRDAEGEFYISPMVDNPDKIVALDEMIYDFMNAQYTYTYSPYDGKNPLPLKTGRVLFELVSNYSLVTTREDDVKVGVLPYPMWDSNQDGYKTLSWNGVLAIPTTVKNEEMVGDVIEMLAWFSEPVNVAFYETLLGSKVADAPEDVEMLRIVWDGQVSDIGLVFASSSSQMDRLIYGLAHHVSSGMPAISTIYRQNQSSAGRMLLRMLNPK